MIEMRTETRRRGTIALAGLALSLWFAADAAAQEVELRGRIDHIDVASGSLILDDRGVLISADTPVSGGDDADSVAELYPGEAVTVFVVRSADSNRFLATRIERQTHD